MITDNEPVPRLIIDVSGILPKDERPRSEDTFDFAEFLARTRRYHAMTHNPPQSVRYARGLDSNPEDFA